MGTVRSGAAGNAGGAKRAAHGAGRDQKLARFMCGADVRHNAPGGAVPCLDVIGFQVWTPSKMDSKDAARVHNALFSIHIFLKIWWSTL